MKVIPFSEREHYEEVASWWAQHGWPVIPLDHLSDTGFVVETDDRAICAGWLYFTGSAFVIFEWAVVNPEAQREERKAGLDLMLDFVRKMAAAGGAKTVFTSAHSRNQAWISRLAKHDFSVTDSNMTNLVAKVGG